MTVDLSTTESQLLRFFLQLAILAPNGPRPYGAEIVVALSAEAERNGLGKVRIYSLDPANQLDIMIEVQRDLGSLQEKGLLVGRQGTTTVDLTPAGKEAAESLADCPLFDGVAEEFLTVLTETRVRPREAAETLAHLQNQPVRFDPTIHLIPPNQPS